MKLLQLISWFFLVLREGFVLGQNSSLVPGINFGECSSSCSHLSGGLVDGIVCEQDNINEGTVSDDEAEAYVAARDLGSNVCNCAWDLKWVDEPVFVDGDSEATIPGYCESRCDCDAINDKDSTAQPPEWDIERSGFTSSTVADEISFAIKKSTCYPDIEYAFGSIDEIQEDDWEPWLESNGDVTYSKDEDCKISVAHNYIWWQHKNDPLRTVHDDESPLLLGEQVINGTLARVPLTPENLQAFLDDRTSSYPLYNKFLVYDGCLNVRESTEFNLAFGDDVYPIQRYVTNVLKFKIEFPLELETCTNVTVNAVEFEDVLVNQTVFCTDTGGFGAKLQFKTFVSSDYYIDEDDATYDVAMTGPESVSECFELTMTAQDNSVSCANDGTTCIQDWELDIIPDPESAACDDVCKLDGLYDFNVTIGTLGSEETIQRNFQFDIASADFCTRVIAEAVVTDSMSTYRDAGRTVDSDVFFLDSTIYLKAEYDSDDATIQDVEKLYFKVTNFHDDLEYDLWLNKSITDLGSTVNFDFAETGDSESANPFFLWPQFDAVREELGLVGAIFPVTLEMCLGANVTFWGNENDGSSGTGYGNSTGPSLLEMIDGTSFVLTEVKKSIVLLENGSWKYVDDENGDVVSRVDAVDVGENRGDEKRKNSPRQALNISIISLLIVILLTIGTYTAIAVWKKKNYEKVVTRVPSTRDVLVSA